MYNLANNNSEFWNHYNGILHVFSCTEPACIVPAVQYSFIYTVHLLDASCMYIHAVFIVKLLAIIVMQHQCNESDYITNGLFWQVDPLIGALNPS